MPGHELRPGGVRGAWKQGIKGSGSSSRSDDTTKSCRVRGRALRTRGIQGAGRRSQMLESLAGAPLPPRHESTDALELDIPGQRHLFDEEDPRWRPASRRNPP